VKLKLIVFIFTLLLFFQTAVAEEKLVYVDSKVFSELKFYPIKKAPAQVYALATVTLNSELNSIVDQVNILAGIQVKKGDVLISLNCDDYSNHLTELYAVKEESKANLDLKKYQLARSLKLYKSKNISEIELKTDQANVKIYKARLNSIQAKINLAKKNINRCEIKAPYNGVILERMVNKGEMARIGQKLLTLTDPNQSEVLVQLPIGLVDGIKISESFFVYQQNKYPVKLRAIIPTIETRARHQQYRFSFINKQKPLLNSFGELQVTLSQPYLTASILVKRDNQNGIFTLKDNRAEFIPVENAQIGRPFAITLHDSTQVIIAGQQNLINGQHVKQIVKSRSQ